ncbi:MAG TPA: hypothetical protein VLA28_03195, partial [Afifellaceae bacterium]|nr:hypothetical protein [Afifellaceae bacterium]
HQRLMPAQWRMEVGKIVDISLWCEPEGGNIGGNIGPGILFVQARIPPIVKSRSASSKNDWGSGSGQIFYQTINILSIYAVPDRRPRRLRNGGEEHGIARPSHTVLHNSEFPISDAVDHSRSCMVLSTRLFKERP